MADENLTANQRLYRLVESHLGVLYREQRRLLKAGTRKEDLEVAIPVEWALECEIDPVGEIGKCFRLRVIADPYTPTPVVRIRHRVTEREMLLNERLRQRSDALNRVAAENERLRSALLAVLAEADVEDEWVRCDEIHDVIGGELIAELMAPGHRAAQGELRVTWIPEPPATITAQEFVDRIAGLMMVPQVEILAAFKRASEEAKILGIDGHD